MHSPQRSTPHSPTVAGWGQAGTQHYENFPVASWLCPPALRPAILAIYRFARCADDLADEGDATPEQRLQDLGQYREALQACATHAVGPGERWSDVFAPLAAVIAAHQLPLGLLHDLISAFEQDVRYTAEGRRYRDMAELLDYCSRSANPVGRLLLHLYGVTEPLALQRSDQICSALQLINFWQDLGVDIPRGRYYLPRDRCAALGVDPQSMLQSPESSALIAENVQFARALMQKGAPLVKRVPGRAGWELRLVVQGGLRILDKIAALQYRTLATRVRLRAWDLPIMLWRALWM